MSDHSAPKESADWLRALQGTTRALARRDGVLGSVLNDLAASHGDRVALIGETSSLTFNELAARSNRYARWALANGVGKGDCVALLMPNCPDYLAIWAGITRAGGVVALVNANLTGPALAHCLDIVQPKHAIVDARLMNAYEAAMPLRTTASELLVHGGGTDAGIDLQIVALSAAPLALGEAPEVTLSDRALYIYTSGTTGLPKAANVSHRRVIEWCYWFAGLMDTTADDRMYNCLPMYHSVGGVVAIGSALVNGGSVVIRERFSASRFWDDVVRNDCTLFQYIGELCRYLLKAPPSMQENVHRLRVCCGNGMRADVWEAFQQRFAIPRILEFYAATEGSFSLYNVPGKPGAIGRIPGFMSQRSPVALVKRDDDSGDILRGPDGRCIRCGADEPGEAIGRLPVKDGGEGGRFEGYAGQGHDDKKVLRDVFAPGDRWFRTGDVMRRDGAGFYYFMDRTGDTFRWKGENVSTLEVANAISSCPGVAEVAVYGVEVPGADGRAGMAAIVSAAGFSLDALAQHLEASLPSYARPVFMRLTPSLHMTDTFKQKKAELVEQGFDPSRTDDAIFKRDASGNYRQLTAEVIATDFERA